MGKTLVLEGDRFFFRTAEQVTIYSRTILRLAELGLARISVGRVTISEAGVRKAQAMQKDPPRYYRKGTKGVRHVETREVSGVQARLPGSEPAAPSSTAEAATDG